MQPLQCDLHPHVAEHQGKTDCARNDPNRTRRTHEVPFIAGCSHFTQKKTRFRAPASSPKQTPCNSHAAITMRFASTRCRTPRENRLPSKGSKLHQRHTRGTFHRWLQPLYTEKHKVSWSGFLPPKKPCNSHAAIRMRFAATRTHPCSYYNAICIHTLQNTKGEPIVLETIQTAPAAHTRYCSSPAAATLHGKSQGFVLRLPPQNKPHATVMQPLQCVLQLHVPIHAAITMRFASTRCRTPRENRLRSKRSKAHPPHTRGTIHRRLQPLYTEKHKVSCPGFLPKTNPMQQSCSHYNAFCSYTCPSIQSLQCDLHPRFPRSPLLLVTASLRHHFPSSSLT